VTVAPVVCIPTAGTGSRLGVLTKYLNKSLISVDNRPVLSHIIEKYPTDTHFVIPVGHASELVEQYVGIAHPESNITLVRVDVFEGEASGLGHSLLQCRTLLECPFIFHSCDTIVSESIPLLGKNWIGLGGGPPSREFRRVRTDNHMAIEFIDKDSEVTADQYNYIGLAGIKDHQDFWENMELGGAEAVNLGEVFGLNFLLKNGIETIGFTWFDSGSHHGLATARTQLQSAFTPNILDKEDEAIWFVKKRVIKFSADTTFIQNRVSRANTLADYTPKITQV